MNELMVSVRFGNMDFETFAEALSAKIAEEVATAVARQMVVMAAQMRVGNADALLRQAIEPAAPAVAEKPVPVVKVGKLVDEKPAVMAKTAPAVDIKPAVQGASVPKEEAPALPVAKAVPMAPAKVWSEERNAHLNALRARGDTWDEIHKALCRLAGPPIASADSCMVHWYDLKKKGRVDELPAAKLAKKLPKEILPARVSHETARHWAGERGLVHGAEALDLKKVNGKRLELGLSPFEIIAEGGRRVPA